MRQHLRAKVLWGLVCWGLMLGTPAQARIPVYEGDDVQVTFGGYLRSFTAWQRLDDGARALYRLGGLNFEALGLQSTIARTELKVSAWERLTLEVHSRFQWTLASQPVLSGGQLLGAGAGVSVAPPRWVDLQSDLVDEPHQRLDHDLDRLLLRVYLGDVDLSVGRQAIRWGNSTLFGVSDIWAAFSPFDLDTSQRRGVDAIRAVWGVSEAVELDIVVVDRGTLEDLSGGVRANLYVAWGQLYGAVAKSFEDLALAAGLSVDINTVKLRGEVMMRYDLDRRAVEIPRATVGVDWFASGDLILGAEVHLNGFGTAETTDLAYLEQAQTEAALTRGEGYLLGRLYSGAYASYKPHELLTLTASGMVNLLDATALLSWGVTYEVAQSVDLGLGGYHGLGDGLELGFMGQLLFVQLAAYF